MTEYEEKLIAEMLKKINDIQNERNEKHIAWLKQIITLAVGLLSILVALKKSDGYTIIQHLFFVVTIGLLSFGIFFGCIALFSEVQNLDAFRKRMVKYTEALLGVNPEKYTFEFVPVAKLYKVCEKIALVCFSLSLFALIFYASFI